MRHEDERKPAEDFGVTVDGVTSWFLEDRQQAVNITQRVMDGVWTASLEDFSEGCEQ
jgi:hypothetical protein